MIRNPFRPLGRRPGPADAQPAQAVAPHAGPRNANLARYREVGFDHVHGWCDERLFDTVDLLAGADINRNGGCMEIGIHRGKLYILLNQVIDAGCRSYAVDVFDNQSLNIDRSGEGSLAEFRANLEKYDVHRGRNTEIVIGDSTDPGLRLEERIGPGTLRFISIDGGHTPEHTLSDLRLATTLVANEGVVILDDILNHHWLGVIEGVNLFLSGRPTLVPFAIGHNKLYLCKLSYQSAYFELFRTLDFATKIVRFHGHALVAL